MKPTRDDPWKILSWMRLAGRWALRDQPHPEVYQKPDRTPVTKVEQQMERMLIGRIRRSFPDDQILSEESGLQGPSSEYLWVIDPIDGTKPYLRGLPFWGISIGLLRGGEPLEGFIFFPAMKDFYWCGVGGACRNGRPLQLPPDQEYQDDFTFLAVASNHHVCYNIDYPRLQAYGSTVFHMACLVRGLAIGVLTRRLNLWDFAGFMPFFSHLKISLELASGAALDIPGLVRGQKTPEGLLAAPERFMARLHSGIMERQERRATSNERDTE